MADLSTDIGELVEQVNRVLKQFKATESLESCRWKSEVVDTVVPGEVPHALRRLGAGVREGWLKCQRGLAVVHTADELPNGEAVLEGELILTDGSSVLLRPDGRGAVRIVRQQEIRAGEDSARTVIAMDVEHRATPLAAARQVQSLRYRVYFGIDIERGAVPCGSRFCGFGYASGEHP